MGPEVVALDTNIVWDIVEAKDEGGCWDLALCLNDRFRFCVTDVTVSEIWRQIVAKPELLATWIVGRDRLVRGLAWDAVLFRQANARAGRSDDYRGKVLALWGYLKRVRDGSVEPAASLQRWGFGRLGAFEQNEALKAERADYVRWFNSTLERLRATRDVVPKTDAPLAATGIDVWAPIFAWFAERADSGTYNVTARRARNDGFDMRIMVAAFDNAGGPNAWIITRDAGIVAAVDESPARGRAVSLARFFALNETTRR
jgi:hypothetical protein